MIWIKLFDLIFADHELYINLPTLISKVGNRSLGTHCAKCAPRNNRLKHLFLTDLDILFSYRFVNFDSKGLPPISIVDSIKIDECRESNIGHV
jgi:hypothetical protein